MFRVIRLICNLLYCMVLLGLRAIYGYEAKSILDHIGLPPTSCVGVLGAVWMMLAVTFLLRVVEISDTRLRIASEAVVEFIILSVNTAVASDSPAGFWPIFGVLSMGQILEACLFHFRSPLIAGMKMVSKPRRRPNPSRKKHLSREGLRLSKKTRVKSA